MTRVRASSLRVGDLMDARSAYAAPDMTVGEFVVEHALGGGRLQIVLLEAGRLAGTDHRIPPNLAFAVWNNSGSPAQSIEYVLTD